MGPRRARNGRQLCGSVPRTGVPGRIPVQPILPPPPTSGRRRLNPRWAAAVPQADMQVVLSGTRGARSDGAVHPW